MRRNTVLRSQIDGIWTEDQHKIQEHITSFYKLLYHEVIWDRPRLDGLTFSSLFLIEANDLEANVSEEEVKVALDSLAGEKCWGLTVSP